MPLFDGVAAGLAAGILMGLISHAGFKSGIFKSSLFVIDGTFVQHMLRQKSEAEKAVLLGIPVHLLTSMSFGIGYVVPITILELDLLNAQLIALYVFILWLSMLFVALPIAGQGLLGKNLGSLIWLEQIVFHIFFGIGLWGTLYLFH
jgi:hypothetical protein